MKNQPIVFPAFLAALFLTLLLAFEEAFAIPQFARKHGMDCSSCHAVVPKLNNRGLAYLERGFRLSPEVEARIRSEAGRLDGSSHNPPFSAWITGRYERQFSRDFDESYLPKVELISGGALGDWGSFFVEWRMVSLETTGDGTLRDRSGRIEDALISWDITESGALTVGQFRSLQQVDVSRRWSISEPTVFSSSLPGKPADRARIESLRAFSPSGRSPGVGFSYHGLQGDSPADGLFSFIQLPFVGELSVPLGPEARDEASFELRGPLKGVYLESFYRMKGSSAGIHAFVEDDRNLATGVLVARLGSFDLTTALGMDKVQGRRRRMRSSAEIEYHMPPFFGSILESGIGFRVEQVSRAGRKPAYIPYLILAGPNTKHTAVVQLQYRSQKEENALVLDVSTIF